MFGTVPRTVVLVVLATVVVSSAGLAVAQSNGGPSWEAQVYSQFSGQVSEFNKNVDNVDLGPAGKRLAGTSANVYVEGPDGTATFSFKMDENNHITDLSRDTVSEADLKITTSRATVEAIASSKNPAATFRSAYAKGDISIQADYGLGGAISGKHGGIVKGVTNWGFWKAAGIFKGFLG
ncbi:MAG: hypothetical protein ABEJ28_07710 [Salinigranum sp.]